MRTTTTTTAPEQLKQIQGYDDYFVSNRGYIVSHKYGKRRILKPSLCGQKYEQVNLSLNGKLKVFKVHRLVACAFFGAVNDSLLCVNHKDGNKSNNDISNLEMCTQAHNVREALRTGFREKMSVHCNPGVRREVLVYDPIDDIEYTAPSMYACAKILGVKIASVYNCCTGRQNTVKGFLVSYK